MSLIFSSTAAPIEDQGVKILVYGPAGIGKTVLAATLPDETIIVSAEGGLLSLQPANLIRMFGASREIPVIKIKSGADFIEAYNFIATSAHAKHFGSVGIDSLSEIAEVVLTAELTVAKDPRQAYGAMQDTMAKYIRLFRDLPNRHVYMSAKRDREKDDKGVMLYGPSMPGKNLLQSVPHFFDEVFSLEMSTPAADGSSYRFLRTRANIQFQAKDRSGALDEIEEPNLAKVISKIKQHVK